MKEQLHAWKQLLQLLWKTKHSRWFLHMNNYNYKTLKHKKNNKIRDQGLLESNQQTVNARFT